jgi:hypothetical protein
MEGFVVLAVLIMVLTVLGAAAAAYGVDSRDFQPRQPVA